MTGLFVPGEFWSHSGVKLPFKIEADALTERDVDLFGCLIVERLWSTFLFRRVIGVPKSRPGGRDNGGILAQYVRRHLKRLDRLRDDGHWTLVVDDVLTTGASMAEERAKLGEEPSLGAVIFARGPCPVWVRSVFTLNARAW